MLFRSFDRPADLYAEFGNKNDSVTSFRCSGQDTNLCVLEQLHVHVKLLDERWAGTSDRVFLAIGDDPCRGGHRMYMLADDPDRGTQMNKFIDLEDAFASDAVTIKDIKRAHLYDIVGDGRIGSDQLGLQGMPAPPPRGPRSRPWPQAARA